MIGIINPHLSRNIPYEELVGIQYFPPDKSVTKGGVGTEPVLGPRSGRGQALIGEHCACPLAEAV